ncbi:YadA-like family protein [Scandinavium sp. NPDC088450]|uniref:YadA-like family protein n=1 Tax=Scandinavium sp. NPDC088450 TaxID=3364514 RepID=UPI00384F4EDF
MKMKLIALAIMAGAVSGMAHAELTAADQQLLNNYLAANSGIPADKVTTIRQAGSLQQVRDYISHNTYWDGQSLVDFPPLDAPVTPVNQIPLTTLTPATQPANQEVLEQKFGQVKANIARTAEQVTALNTAEGQSRLEANQARTAEQTTALHKAILEQKFGQVKANLARTAEQVTALNTAEGQSRLEANQARTAEQTTALHAAILDQKFGQVKANIARTAEQVTALNAAEGQSRLEANQARTAEQTTALHAAILEQKFGQVKANIARTAEQVTALNTAEGQSRLEANQARTAEQVNARNSAEKHQQIDQIQHELDIRTDRQNEIDQDIGKAFQKTQQLDDQQSTAINTLTVGVQQNKNTGAYAQSRADAAYANTQANQQALKATNHRVAENSQELANHEQRIQTLEANNNASFGKLKNEVDDNRQRASAAISGVAAMANIPQVIQGQTFSVGAGVGTTDSESALAVGFSARATEHVVVKASVSDDTQQNFVVGGGVSYGW